MALRIAGDPDLRRSLRMLMDDRQQISGRVIWTVGRRGIAADEKHIVHSGLRHRCQQPVQVGAITDHSGCQVHGD